MWVPARHRPYRPDTGFQPVGSRPPWGRELLDSEQTQETEGHEYRWETARQGEKVSGLRPASVTKRSNLNRGDQGPWKQIEKQIMFDFV